MTARLMIGDVQTCDCPYCGRPFDGPIASLLREPRLVSKIRTRDDGCWEWVGARDKFGYGVVAQDYFGVGRAHRAVYLIAVGPIPDGYVLDHLCRNTWCVRPDHLEATTHADNCRRGVAGEVNAARQLAKTHCKHGHEYTPENTLFLKGSGWRRCRECNREAQRRRDAKRKAAA